jgi:hypothetical protein
MERIRNMAIAGLAALVLAAGALAAAGPAASAATPACGQSCLALASQAFGTSDVSAVFYPRFAMPGKGQSVILSSAGNLSSEDWRVTIEVTVAQVYAAGIVGAAVGRTWPSDEAFEFQYAPNGNFTGHVPGRQCSGRERDRRHPPALRDRLADAVDSPRLRQQRRVLAIDQRQRHGSQYALRADRGSGRHVLDYLRAKHRRRRRQPCPDVAVRLRRPLTGRLEPWSGVLSVVHINSHRPAVLRRVLVAVLGGAALGASSISLTVISGPPASTIWTRCGSMARNARKLRHP